LGSVREYVGATQASLRCATENPAKRRLVLASIFSESELPLELRALQKRAYAGTYVTEAFMLLNIDHEEMARKCLWISLRLYPRNLLNLLVISYLFRSLGWGKLVYWASALRRKVLKRETYLKERETIKWWLQ
jgi:hypothetical protein